MVASPLLRRTLKLLLIVAVVATLLALSSLSGPGETRDQERTPAGKPSPLSGQLLLRSRTHIGSKVIVAGISRQGPSAPEAARAAAPRFLMLRQLEMIESHPVRDISSHKDGEDNQERDFEATVTATSLPPPNSRKETIVNNPKRELATRAKEVKSPSTATHTYLENDSSSVSIEVPTSSLPQPHSISRGSNKSRTKETRHDQYHSTHIENPDIIEQRQEPLPSCDEECQQFQTLLQSNWPPGKPRAAFYYLTQSSRLEYLRDSLASVDRYFNDKFHYPIIIFHEDEFMEHKDTVRRMTTSPVFFQKVKFELPDFITGPVVKNIPCLSEVSYRHMCRFHSKGVYEQPIMDVLDYHWRLDDDSLLLSNVTYDVFSYLHSRRLKYGYVWIFLDAMSCTEGLWEATETFAKAHKIKPTFFADWRRPKLFYNNFEISSLDIWRSPQYKAYVEYLDKLGGIFYHRWGDAPIKGLAISLFVQRNETHFFKDVEYQHRTFVNNATQPAPPSQYLYRPGVASRPSQKSRTSS